MPLEATLRYHEDLVRYAVFCFWRRAVGMKTVFIGVALTAWCGVLVVRGDSSWQIGATGAIAGMVLMLCAAIYIVHYRNATAKLRCMGEQRATLNTDNHALTLASDAGSATLPWSSVKELWKFERVWLLLFSPAQFSTLPTADLSPEMQAFVEDRVRVSGGRIR